MILTVKTFDGHNINDTTNYRAWFPKGTMFAQSGSSLVYVQRSENYPVLGAKIWNPKTLPLWIDMRGVIGTQIDVLNGWFDTRDKNLKVLVATDGSAKDWYLNVTVENVVNVGSASDDGATIFIVSLSVPDPIWKSVTQVSDTWNITATGQTHAITPAGNRETLPSYEITPTGATSAGYAYHRYCIIRNVTSRAFDNYPIDITAGGINTQTLVSGSKMQADGDDWRVMVDGAEVNRWITAPNTTVSKMWVALNLAPKVDLSLGVAIAGSGVIGEMTFKNTDGNKSAIDRLPNTGILLCGTELFTYSAKNANTRKVTITLRAAKGTSMAAHSVSDAVYWIEHDIWMLYGDSAAVAQETDDTTKPVLDMVNSTNTSWVYTEFADNALKRAGSWKPALTSGGMHEGPAGVINATIPYSDSHGGFADPAAEMGLMMSVWDKNGRVQGETASLEWELYNPAGMTTVTSNGETYRGGPSFPAHAKLQSSPSGETWTTIWSESSPVTVTSWTAWTHTSSALTSNPQHIHFLFKGSLTANASNVAYFSVFGATIALYSSGVPSVTLNAEAANYMFEARLTNNLTAYFIDIKYPMNANKTLIIDTEAKTVTFDGIPAVGALVVNSLRGRSQWLALTAGVANTLQFDQVGTGNVTIVTKYKDRNS